MGIPVRAALVACLLLTPLPAAAATDEALALAAINDARKSAGLAPVTLDEEMSEAALLHAKYLRKNRGRPEIAGLKAHEEAPNLAGYTKKGAKAGKGSDIASVPLPHAVAQWIGSLYHRTPILVPSLKKVGLAQVTDEHGTSSLLYFDDAPWGDAGFPVAYPGDGQKAVPLAFSGEIPDPIPAGEPPAGYPVTLAFGFKKVKDVKASLRESGRDDELPLHLSTPEKPATFFSQGGVVCMFPKRPLKPGTTYEASVRATVDGVKGRWTWSFTTVKPSALEASDARALDEAVGRVVLVRGAGAFAGDIQGYSFLQIGDAGGAVVSLMIPDSAWPAGAKKSARDLSRFVGQPVEALGTVNRIDAKHVNIDVASADDVRVVESEAAPLDADGPAPAAAVNRFVRVRGRVKNAGRSGTQVYLHVGDSAGKMVSAWVSAAAWKEAGAGREPVTAVGRVLVVQGVLKEHQGRYLNVNVENASQLVWQ